MRVLFNAGTAGTAGIALFSFETLFVGEWRRGRGSWRPFKSPKVRVCIIYDVYIVGLSSVVCRLSVCRVCCRAALQLRCLQLLLSYTVCWHAGICHMYATHTGEAIDIG
jgi:hypothetical protein